VRFIDEHKARFGGVEPICRVLSEHGLKIAASTYYKTKAMPPSARAVRDAGLLAEIRRVHAANFGVYGARKIWHQLRRDGHPVARCTVERLMRDAGLAGAVRGKKVRTTVADPSHRRADDLVVRDFTAGRPKPVLGRRLHPRRHVHRGRLHRVRRRRLLPGDRGLVGGDRQSS
jgi:putative transposase